MNNSFETFIHILNRSIEFLFAPLDILLARLPLPHFILDALIDTIHMLPFLLLIFYVVEWVEYRFHNKMENLIRHASSSGFLLGAIVGCIPQCGFSVIASALYARRIITLGALMAVYLSTSDEAIPIILSRPEQAHIAIKLIITKVVIALIFGFLIDFILRKRATPSRCDECEDNKGAHEGLAIEGCCRHNMKGLSSKKQLILHPLLHTARIAGFIFLITLGINYLIVALGGEEKLSEVFLGGTIWQPLITALIGLIPNCAASVAITMVYLDGGISFGAAIAGLSSGVGIGLLVLLKENSSLKESIKIILLLYLISVFAGLLIQYQIG